MTTERWRQHDPVDGDIAWRAIRDGGGVVAGLVKLGRSTLVYTYDARLAELDGARFASAAAARGAVQAALAAPARPGVRAIAPIPFRRAARDSRGRERHAGQRLIAGRGACPR